MRHGGEKIAVRRIALSLGLAGATFLVLSMLPAEMARLILNVALPLGTGFCLLALAVMRAPSGSDEPHSARDNAPATLKDARECGRSRHKGVVGIENRIPSGDKTESNRRPEWTILLSIALSCFVVDLAIALFPVCLYHEESPLLAALVSASQDLNTPVGTLTQPAFLCSLIVIATSIAVLAATKKRSVPLSALYYAGFAMTTFDYVAFPYHFPGGTPLAVAEAGRIVIALFVAVVALRLLGSGKESPTPLFLKIGVAAFSAMLIADMLAMAAQLQPAYDYSDFRFRTVFSGIGITALVILLLGPLARINRTIRQAGGIDNAGACVEQEPSLEGRFEQACASFSSDYGLSTREGEVFGLIANGRDVPYIENELVLAKSTVKTHIKHIYEKCGVSSRQDLLDLFESYKN